MADEPGKEIEKLDDGIEIISQRIIPSQPVGADSKSGRVIFHDEIADTQAIFERMIESLLPPDVIGSTLQRVESKDLPNGQKLFTMILFKESSATSYTLRIVASDWRIE